MLEKNSHDTPPDAAAPVIQREAVIALLETVFPQAKDSDWGINKFFGKQISELIEAGKLTDFTHENLKNIAESGLKFFRSFEAQDLFNLLKVGYRPRDFELLFALQFPAGPIEVTTNDASALIHQKLNIEELASLLDLKTADGTFYFRDINQACLILPTENVHTEANLLTRLVNQQGNLIFSEPAWLKAFLLVGGNHARALELLAIRDRDNSPLFSDAYDLAKFQQVLDKNPAALKLASLRGANGENVFRYAEDITSFAASGGTLKRAQGYIEHARKCGRTINGYELSVFQEARIGPALARKFIERGIDPVEANLVKKLGLKSNHYANDGRPKCLIILNTDDEQRQGIDGAQRAFLDISVPLFTSLAMQYDMKITAVYSRRDLATVLEHHGDPMLTVICGHGSANSIALARDLNRYGIISHDEADRCLKTGDNEIKQRLATLPHGSTLMLDSCSTAHGGHSGENLASDLSSALLNQRVIACDSDFSVREIKFHSVLPLKINIKTGDRRNRRNSLVEWENGKPLVTEIISPHNQESPISSTVIRDFGHKLKMDEERKVLAKVYEHLSELPPMQSEGAEACRKLIRQLPSYKRIYRALLPFEDMESPISFCFGRLLKEPWCAAMSLTSYRHFYKDTLNSLASHNYFPVHEPKAGDVAVYVRQLIGRRTYEATHFGVFNGQQVESKLSMLEGMRHPINGVPPSKASHVIFFRKATPEAD